MKIHQRKCIWYLVGQLFYTIDYMTAEKSVLNNKKKSNTILAQSLSTSTNICMLFLVTSSK